ncbi:MAG: hypothetical protein M0C28_44745 [Candidatus Moduliflexus flocculans]|nr:hypothetical protein [Candidatus Moduliflexus flocculans]
MKDKQALDRIPAPIANKDVKIVDAAVTARTAVAVDSAGQVYVWGENEFGLLTLPAGIENEKIVSVEAGRAHFMALSASGKIFVWGSNSFNQLTAPKALADKKVTSIAANYYQSYAIAEDGTSYGWGQDGYYLGTDDLGRDNVNALNSWWSCNNDRRSSCCYDFYGYRIIGWFGLRFLRWLDR